MLNRLRTVPVFLFLIVTACATFDPIGAAETLEQKAFAAYGTFVVYEENAADLMGSANVPDEVKVVIQATDSIAKPAADILVSVAREVVKAREALEAAPDDASLVDKLNIAILALNAAYLNAQPKIDALRLAINDAR